jgi:hypothetical protein
MRKKRKLGLVIALIIIAIGASIILGSCNSGPHYKTIKTKKDKVHCYKGRGNSGGGSTSSTSDDLLFWYVLFGNNNSYYYYSSPTPVTNFSGVTFSRSTSFPTIVSADGSNVKPEQETEEMEVDASQIADEIEASMPQTEQEEVTEQTTETETEASETSSESSSESSSDGGGDSGGGDGGGDGGGGD